MKPHFADIIDIPSVQELMDSLCRISGLPAAILDPDYHVLMSSGQTANCMEHHRMFPEQMQHCSPRELLAGEGRDRSLVDRWQEFSCRNGLVYVCSPLMIGPSHVATLLVGPLLYEPIDPATFVWQAEFCGIQEEAALDHLENVPVVSAQIVREVLGFFATLVKTLTDSSLQSILDEAARRAAERSDKKFRDLFTLAADGMVISDLEGRILEANQSMCDLIGFDHDEFVQGRLTEFVGSRYVSRVPKRIAEIREKGQALYEMLLKHRDGHEIPVEIRGQIIMFDDGRAILGQVRDLSERRKSELALRQSEERFRRIFEDAGIGMTLTMRNGHFAQVNAEFCRFLGYSREELLTKTIEDVTHPEDRAFTNELIREALAGQRSSVNVEKRYLHKNGSTVWGRVKAVYRLSGVKPSLCAVTMIQDITAQKRALEAVQLSEATLKSILVAVPMSVGLVRNRVFRWVNHWMVEELGYSEDELIGRNARMLYESDAEFERARQVKHSQLPFAQMGEVQTRFKCKGGKVIDVLLRSVPIDPEDLSAGIIFTALNISELKRADTELREAFDQAETARHQLNAVLRSLTAGLIVTEPHGRVSLVNPAAEALLALDGEAMIGQPIEMALTSPEVLEKVRLALAGAEETNPVELSFEGRGDGRSLFLQIKVASVKEVQGGVRGAVAILRDVTREHEINQLKDEFISTAAHELRTPMTSILGYTELMLDQLEDFDTTQLREFLQIVFERSETLSQIISDMLDLSRVQSGRLISLEKFPGDLLTLVKQIVASYEYNISDCEIVIDADPDLPLIFFDPRKMTQVLDNLLSNAAKFSPNGGLITVRIRSTGEVISVTVEDHGVGMSPEQKERIFDKFYRADYSNTAVSGLGLGMSLVKSIIEGHGGRIWVDSEPGAGTTVRFTLPGILRAEEE